MSRRIYLASSWRNTHQPRLVPVLREAGHSVYDFRHPTPSKSGFQWDNIDMNWQRWTPVAFAHILPNNETAQAGYAVDKAALDWCDTCVCLLPCGRSAHLEAGYVIGKGKPTLFYLDPEQFEPELMYLLGDGLVTSTKQLLDVLGRL